jgi:hypothetical protein
MNKFIFVGMLYLFAAALLVIGAVEVYMRLEYAVNSELGTMTSADPQIQRMAKFAPGSAATADVVVSSSSGTFEVKHRMLSGEIIRRVAEGEIIPVRFLKHRPEAMLYDGKQLPWNVWKLIVGSLVLSLALWSHRKLREESGGTAGGGDLGDVGAD